MRSTAPRATCPISAAIPKFLRLRVRHFFDTWGTRSTKDLFDYSAEAMPYGAPSLSMESYTEITAYILQANGGVAGASALTDSTAVPISSVTAPQKP